MSIIRETKATKMLTLVIMLVLRMLSTLYPGVESVLRVLSTLYPGIEPRVHKFQL